MICQNDGMKKKWKVKIIIYNIYYIYIIKYIYMHFLSTEWGVRKREIC